MRLDKYLKVSRLIKRRTVAKNASDGQRVLVNDKIAKPSQTLKENDIITIHFGLKVVTVKVTTLIPPKRMDDYLMYELISEEKKS
ncbi:MAG: RNA-binding S4 domain-containing protein [Paracholeplasma sp.]|uniref:RNA-binding S4 domain-containing protein n=1 Tax=Acholeplasma brassicae TaxID=61635 RepID=U4KSH6_9MOLU|nr:MULTISPECIES: RNA-binding S4 domain-containing protein [Paracholeplasma]MDY3196557.1 RNA-binding S4 domain-containing protein [Paracholeplasma sp.]CCV66658.1 RNA-binding S4 domain-containing protein [Paracholeplasma brassicae]